MLAWKEGGGYFHPNRAVGGNVVQAARNHDIAVQARKLSRETMEERAQDEGLTIGVGLIQRPEEHAKNVESTKVRAAVQAEWYRVLSVSLVNLYIRTNLNTLRGLPGSQRFASVQRSYILTRDVVCARLYFVQQSRVGSTSINSKLVLSCQMNLPD